MNERKMENVFPLNFHLHNSRLIDHLKIDEQEKVQNIHNKARLTIEMYWIDPITIVWKWRYSSADNSPFIHQNSGLISQ